MTTAVDQPARIAAARLPRLRRDQRAWSDTARCDAHGRPVPRDRSAQTFVERHAGGKPEESPRLENIRLRIPDIALARRAENRRQLLAENHLEGSHQFEQGYPATRGDVDDLAGHVRRVARQQDALNDIADIGKVP